MGIKNGRIFFFFFDWEDLKAGRDLRRTKGSHHFLGFPVVLIVKNLHAMQEMQV